MTLFVVQHRHAPDACVAGHPEYGPQLLAILAGASEAGVEIRAEAVVDGEHELNLIVEAANSETVVQFMQPFMMMGSVSVRAGSACERVVERGYC